MMLAEMQQQFRDWLARSADAPSLRQGLHAERGLAVYQNNYRTQLVNVLRASYPQLLAWLGEAAFVEAAVQHIDRHPPSSWTLDVYGVDFADTLHALYPNNPDLQELAWIEWNLSDAFVARDAGTVALDQLGDIDWDTARLRLSPSLCLHAVTTNATAIWSALQADSTVPEPEMLDAPAGMIVWRRDFSCQLRQIDAIEYGALSALREDDHFQALCDVLVERLGEAQGVERAGHLLAGWLAAGIVVNVHDERDAA